MRNRKAHNGVPPHGSDVRFSHYSESRLHAIIDAEFLLLLVSERQREI